MAFNSASSANNSSSSFEDAVARARKLAARLSAQAPGGGGGGNGAGPMGGPPAGMAGGQMGGGFGGGGGMKRSFGDDDDCFDNGKRLHSDPIGAHLAALKQESGYSGTGNGGSISGGSSSGGRDGPSKPAGGPYLQGMVQNGEKTLDMMIPGTKVGYIIGKGGEMIRTMQERAGVKMTIFQQTSEATESSKQLRIVGAPDKVDYAKELINDLLTEKELESMKVRTTKAVTNDYGSSRGGGVEVPVPPQYIGLVIGKGGESIKRIQAETGTKIQFDTQKSDANGNKICQISGPPDCVKRAEELIQEIIDNAANYKHNRLRDGEELLRMPVPANKTGTVIGRGGETIRALKAQSGCDIELDKNCKAGPGDEKIFIIRGPPDRITYAQQLITEKINGSHDRSEGGHGGGGGGHHDSYGGGASSGDYSYSNYWQQEQQQQQQQQQQHQPSQSTADTAQDTTQAWAQYYAQMYAQGGTAAAAAVQQQAGDGQADYSKQWADYYRAYGMTKEAEMIENMAKQPKAGAPQGAAHDGHDGSDNKSAPVAYPGYNYGGGYGGSSSNNDKA